MYRLGALRCSRGRSLNPSAPERCSSLPAAPALTIQPAALRQVLLAGGKARLFEGAYIVPVGLFLPIDVNDDLESLCESTFFCEHPEVPRQTFEGGNLAGEPDFLEAADI